MPEDNENDNDALTLSPGRLGTDPADNEHPNQFDLNGVFMRARAEYREPHCMVNDPANEPNANVVVYLKGTLGQWNAPFPYLNDWFTSYTREYRCRAVGIHGYHHGPTRIQAYYLDDAGDQPVNMDRRVKSEETVKVQKTDATLNEWAATPEAVIWIDDSVELDGLGV